jgi:hypothetical protein
MRTMLMTSMMLFLLTDFMYSQCKYIRNETDEFTKKVILETSKVVIKARDVTGQALSFHGYKQNTYRFLKVNWNTLQIVSVGTSEKLMLKLINNEIVEVYTNKYQVSSPIGNYWTITIFYSIDENAFQKLKQHEVVKLRFYTTDGYIDKEVPKGASNKILQMFKCIE